MLSKVLTGRLITSHGARAARKTSHVTNPRELRQLLNIALHTPTLSCSRCWVTTSESKRRRGIENCTIYTLDPAHDSTTARSRSQQIAAREKLNEIRNNP